MNQQAQGICSSPSILAGIIDIQPHVRLYVGARDPNSGAQACLIPVPALEWLVLRL